MHLEYCGIRVTDLDRSLRFYTGLLGLKEARRGHGYLGEDKSVWVLLRDEKSGQQLELNWYPEGHPYHVPYVPGEGLDHIGFVVDDVSRTYQELVAQGVESILGPEETEGWLAYLKDPDGNWIEMYQLTEPKSG